MAGNWKMHCGPAEALALAQAVAASVGQTSGVLDVVLCPPFVDLPVVADALRDSTVRVGAQNAHHENSGAFTGEVSVSMLPGLADYVILGHSERRGYFGETDAFVNRKVIAVLAAGLIPIVCVGEQLGEHESGQTASVVCGQLRGSLLGIGATGAAHLVVAYEPVWAIGTGRAATAEIAQETIALIRTELYRMFGGSAAEAIRIQYGGSVSAANCVPIFQQPDIDGALVGGASLRPDEFATIVQRCAEARAVHS